MKFPSLSVKHTYKLFKVNARLHYDPLGRVQRTDHPDGTFEKVVWTSWDQLSYDRNDTVAGSDWYAAWSNGTAEQQDAAAKALAHNNTPTLQYLDTLARPFYTRQYLADMDLTPPPGKDPVNSYVTLDIEGNRLKVTDGRGKDTLTYQYNMLQSVCRQHSLDSGGQRVLVDAAGQPFCGWDADDRQIRFTYDELRRPVSKELWLYDELAEAWVLEQTLEEMEYGEDQPDDMDHNLRGMLYQSRDGAGVVTIPDYDFKGNPLSSVRQYTADPTMHPDWTGSVALEEDDNDAPVTYTTITTYDALNRVVTIITPDDGLTLYMYNKTGLLYSVDVDDVHELSGTIVTSLVYDAKGQRLKIQYGNGTTTKYTYDPDTFRVTRIRTTRHSDSKELQDLRYWYDPVGNVTLLKDLAQQEVFFANTIVSADQDHTYDALYRLIESEGRELVGNSGATTNSDSTRSGKHPIPFVNIISPPDDPAAVRRYTEHYSYDPVGNMLELFHNAGGTGNWTRTFNISSTSNRLTGCNIGSDDPAAETYAYDNRGNLTGGLNHLVGMVYNAENRLEEVKLTATRSAFYQYDSSGQRVRKAIKESSAVVEVRKYVGGWETYSKYTGSTLDIERESLHVTDDTGRIVLIETQTNAGTPVPILRYQYSNHLGSATLELDEAGAVISYEEYYPYGSTSFQAGRSAAEVSLKRYRYTGKERDEETGLYYHGARYYIPWLARWSAVDPLQSEMPQWSSYNYGFCNPITWTDSTGMQPEEGHDPNALLIKVDPVPKDDATRVNRSPVPDMEIAEIPDSITAEEAARIADNVYGGPGVAKLIGGWKRAEAEMTELSKKGVVFNNAETGFQSALYERVNSEGVTEYAYATAGTNDLRDVREDANQALGLAAPQFEQSVWNARLISEKLGNSQLTFVGHSLGGGLASANALATGKDAITFNAAGLHPNTKAANELNRSAKIDAYVVQGEIVDYSQRVLGLTAEGTRHELKASYAPQVLGTKADDAYRFYQRVENHMMGRVIQLMKRQGIR